MDKKPLISKYLAIGIILLFVGTYFIPSTSQKIEKSSPTSKDNTLYVGTDMTPPSVKIVKPEKGRYYIFGIKIPIISVPTTVIYGRIWIKVEASDNESGMNYVEFYIDDQLKFTDHSAPYMYIWTQRGFLFPYQISVRAYDNAGNYAIFCIKAWKIF
jgi:hypothetical protein